MTNFFYVLNQTGRNRLRDALAECLKPGLNPEVYADGAATEADVDLIDGEPEISVEVPARNNIHGIPWTITVAGPDFFNAEPMDE